MASTKRDVCRVGKCAICGFDFDCLVIHHWFEPPEYVYHEALVCGGCNTDLTINLWDAVDSFDGGDRVGCTVTLFLPNLRGRNADARRADKWWHVLPSLELQKAFVAVGMLQSAWFEVDPDAEDDNSYCFFGGIASFDAHRQSKAVRLAAMSAFVDGARGFCADIHSHYPSPLPEPILDLWWCDPFKRGERYKQLFAAFTTALTAYNIGLRSVQGASSELATTLSDAMDALADWNTGHLYRGGR